MPMPFHCIECDKPISIAMHGLCDKCKSIDVADFQEKQEEE
tara:strand:- start:279 stop:401 length:123 start_codon:yes stop_codon:yes gene_type:complete